MSEMSNGPNIPPDSNIPALPGSPGHWTYTLVGFAGAAPSLPGQEDITAYHDETRRRYAFAWAEDNNWSIEAVTHGDVASAILHEDGQNLRSTTAACRSSIILEISELRDRKNYLLKASDLACSMGAGSGPSASHVRSAAYLELLVRKHLLAAGNDDDFYKAVREQVERLSLAQVARDFDHLFQQIKRSPAELRARLFDERTIKLQDIRYAALRQNLLINAESIITSAASSPHILQEWTARTVMEGAPAGTNTDTESIARGISSAPEDTLLQICRNASADVFQSAGADFKAHRIALLERTLSEKYLS